MIMHDKKGSQRLSVDRLQQWEALGYGMFIHFGMSTFVGEELPAGGFPASLYAPDKLDVYQWVQVARDAGMRYAVLCAKHVAGHCLWPSKHTDYHVGNSGNRTDVVEAFVEACAKHGILPGLYYCSWDNHHDFNSGLPSRVGWSNAYTTHEYRDFQMKQVEELLTQYGPIAEMWIDIPAFLGVEGRVRQYAQIASLQPDTVIMLNQGFGNGEKVNKDAWPTDLAALERSLPSNGGNHSYYNSWYHLDIPGHGPGEYYVPGEVCDTIGREWFYKEGDPLRSDSELLAMYLLCRTRGCNLLLDVPPDPHGLIPKETVDALMRLKRNAGSFS